MSGYGYTVDEPFRDEPEPVVQYVSPFLCLGCGAGVKQPVRGCPLCGGPVIRVIVREPRET